MAATFLFSGLHDRPAVTLPYRPVSRNSLCDFSRAAMATNTSSTVIDGKLVAKKIRHEIASKVTRIKDLTGIVPSLAVIRVGSRKDSQTYVCNKKKACEEVGIASFEVSLSEDCTEEEVINHISEFNSNPLVHGILVQLPLPHHINEDKILNAGSIEKDVDGFRPLSIDCLAMQGMDPLFGPCTRKGCMELLSRYKIEVKGEESYCNRKKQYCWEAS